MTDQRITLFAGHYGSGKTTFAINWVQNLRTHYPDTPLIFADLDIVNPFFRGTDHRDALEAHAITVVAPPYAGSNVDLPFLPQEMNMITDRTEARAVVDLGGDERGVLALGHLMQAIKDENNFAMYFVINKYRLQTADPSSTLQLMRTIEATARLPFSGIINNSNLGTFTTAQTVRDALPYANAVSQQSGLPLIHTGYDTRLEDELSGQIPHPYPLTITEEFTCPTSP